jgi:CHAT domain-containing protein
LLGDGHKLSIAELRHYKFAGIELLTLSACNTAFSAGGNGKEIESFAMLAQEQGAQSVLASLWSVADESTKELMQAFYRTREANKGTSKAEALRQAQLALLHGNHRDTLSDMTRGVVQISRDSPSTDAQSNTAPQFVKDPGAPFAHPYYWAPFILIGNWR